MKILFINDYGYEVGGAEKIMLSLKSIYEAQGHQVKIMSGNEKSPNKSDIYFNDYSFRSFKSKSLSRYLLYIYNPFSYFSVRKALKTFQPDIVHIHNMQKASASILHCLKSYKTLMTVHDLTSVDQTAFNKIPALHDFKEELSGYFLYTKNLTYWIQHLKFKFILKGQKNINLMVAPSVAMETVLKQAGTPTSIKVVYNGIPQLPRSRKEYNQYSPVVLFVGRIIEGKGITPLIRAFKLVIKELPNASLKIVGTGEALKNSVRLVDKLGLRDYISFTGSQQNKEISKSYDECDLVVIPSLFYDNLPTVAIEAMMVGRPLVVTYSGGLNELVVQDLNGLKVKPGKVNDLAKAIVKVVSDKALMERMGEASYGMSEKFSLDSFSKTMMDTYQEL